jgi:hypothetical protein
MRAEKNVSASGASLAPLCHNNGARATFDAEKPAILNPKVIPARESDRPRMAVSVGSSTVL